MNIKRISWLLGAILALAVAPQLGCKGEEPAKASAKPAAAGWKSGDKCDVEWNGSWWQGQILEVKGSKYKIHYVGWGANWDEVVDAKRLRPPTGSAQKGSEK